jgi:hypothetical protein
VALALVDLCNILVGCDARWVAVKSPNIHYTFLPKIEGIKLRQYQKITGDVVAIDGKTHRRTASAQSSPLHLLNAWSVENRLVLGQLAVKEKSNEITAISQPVDMLDLKGCAVTAYALNCRKTAAAKVREKRPIIFWR